MRVHSPILRVATQDDAPGVAEVQVAGWRSGYRGLMPDVVLDGLSVPKRAGIWRSILREGRSELIVAELGATIVGFVNFGHSRDPDATTAATGEILAIYVRPTHWHDGIGRALMDTALSKLKSDGYTDVTLWVLDTMARTRSFYEQFGFAVDGATKREAVVDGAVSISEIRFRRPL